MPDAYRNLAPFYDLMAADAEIRGLYRDFRKAINAAIRAHHLQPRVVIDLACGTGNTAIPWARARGCTVIGVDVSRAMLSVARRKAPGIRWVHSNLSRLRLGVQADVVTCQFDALNHVLAADDLQRVFHNTARLLRPGGLFQFDLNTRYFLEWLSTSEKLSRLGPHCFTAYNGFDKASGIATFNQLWFVKTGRLFRRFEVRVHTRSYEDAELRRMLNTAGLHLERVTVMRRLKGRAIRKLYLADKPAPGRMRRRLEHLS
jgi:ubiquinone/menaquinone biosynthesis C-methylase UbiE